MFRKPLSYICLLLVVSACGGNARYPESAGIGPTPALPATRDALIPVVNIATAVGWPASATPVAAAGLRVAAFASGLDHPRWLYVLPNGDVLVAETNAQPSKPKGIKARIQQSVMKRAGAAVPSADRISLLRDADGDGIAEIQTVLLSGLTSPFGMALIDDHLYIANTDSVVSAPYSTGTTEISTPTTLLAELPANPPNYHWTKNLLASPDGSKLYVASGSNSDHGERGMASEERRAAVLEIDRATGGTRVFASGLRNPVGMAWEPESGVLWVSVNERDELGGDLVPDYMTAVVDGGFYGWPYSYYGRNLDPRVADQRPDLVASARVPDYALGAHTASLGLAFAHGNALGPAYQNGAFVGQHGSWNRDPRSGYKVIFVPFRNGRPAGMPRDVLSGFLNDKGAAQGRPVGVAIDQTGALLVADDVGNTIWRVTRSR
jgi:glucose/arabinose dehydrogenase